METRAPYALIGLFVLAAIGAVFGFVYWLNNTGGLGERTAYRVRYENSVAGMLVGAAVLFNGIRVGEVTALSLDPQKPREVTATIAVSTGTPVRTDTKANIDFQGLTGVAVVTLNGGDPASPMLPPNSELAADPLSGQNMTQAARTVLQRLDTILADNSDDLKKAIGGLGNFADALGRNSGRVDGIIAGLERMTGGGSAAAAGAVYDLTAPGGFPPSDKSTAQITIADPTAVLMLDTQKIVVRPKEPDTPSFQAARWSDSLPKLVQARLIQGFENSGYASVGRPADNLASDYQLMIDLRTFEITTEPSPSAVVELSAKLVTGDGKIKSTRVFRNALGTSLSDAGAAAGALNQAFGTVAKELVTWTAEQL